MKALSFVLMLMASVAFVLVGCSDNAAVPVSPTDQSAQMPASLEKSSSSAFTATSGPTGLPDPYVTKYPDDKVMFLHFQQPVYFTADFGPGVPDWLTGPGEVEINGIADPAKRVGQFRGKLRISPVGAEADGGMWEFTYHGTAALDPSTWTWTIPLQEAGHGKGGGLTGMQCRMELIITCPVDFSTWTAAGAGVVISH